MRPIHESHTSAVEALPFDNTYARELEGFYVPWPPATVPAPLLLRLDVRLAEELGLAVDARDAGRAARVFSGNELPAGTLFVGRW